MMKLQIGIIESISKTITEEDICNFINLCGDNNPVHVNEEYAQSTMFGKRVVHGLLVASFISAVLGTKLPGPGTIYLSQNLNFKNPVFIDDTVTAIVSVATVIDEDKGIYELSTVVENQDRKIVIDGTAVVMYK